MALSTAFFVVSPDFLATGAALRGAVPRASKKNLFRQFENFVVGVNRLVDRLAAGVNLLWWLLQCSTREGSWPFQQVSLRDALASFSVR